jgi:hypothetical protein
VTSATDKCLKMNDVSRAEAYKDMRALNEPADPDSRLHAAWLGQASATSEGSVTKQASEHGVLTPEGGRAGTRSRLGTATRLEEQDVASLQRSRVGMRSRAITTAVIGFGFAVALAALSVMLQHLWLFESSRLGDSGIETGPFERPSRSETASPKLIAQTTRGVSGEPIPLGLALRGNATDAVVIVRGLIPGMELSAGRAVARDAWQLPAADLQYAWIAPPRDFVGSADLAAELHLPNSEVVDHKSIQVERTRAAKTVPEGEREQTRRGEETEALPTIAPGTVQNVDNRGIISAAPQMLARPSTDTAGKQETKGRVRAHTTQQIRAARPRRPVDLPASTV